MYELAYASIENQIIRVSDMRAMGSQGPNVSSVEMLRLWFGFQIVNKNEP